MPNLTHLKDKVNNREIEVEQSVKSNQALTSKAINPVSEESGTTQETPFISQGTATANNTSPVDTSPIGKQLEKQGNTIVYNQLYKNTADTTTVDGITFTKLDDYRYKVTGTCTAEYIRLYIYNYSIAIAGGLPTINFKANHKYLMHFIDKPINGVDFGIYVNGGGYQGTNSVKVFDAGSTDTGTNILVFCRIYPTAGEVNFTIDTRIVDLTQWFNGDVPSDLLSYPEHFSWHYNGDLSYNVGELRNCAGRYLECGQDRNIYNPEETYNRVIPNIEYYYYGGSATTITYYDNNRNIISTESVSSGNTFTTPSNCWYINSSVTSNITISEYYLTGDGYDEYYPYVPPVTYDTGTEVLRKAGTVKDTKAPDGTITRNLDTVDLGTLSWSYQTSGTNAAFMTPGLKTYLKKPTNNSRNDYSQLLSNKVFKKYTVSNMIYGTLQDNSIAIDNDGNLWITDTAYTDAQSFKSAMSGVILYYELATPTTEQGTAFSENIQIHDYSYQAWKDTNNEYVTIPQGTKLFYPADYVLFVDSLVKYTDGDAENIALKSDLLSKLPDASSDGTYVLKATKSDNTITYLWVEENQ